MARDNLIEHASTTGDYVRQRFGALAKRHTIIGDIRGHGLWVGVELVRDQTSKEPASEETHTIVDHMKGRGILLNRIGEFNNVLKIRPPLPFTAAHADILIDNMDEVLDAI